MPTLPILGSHDIQGFRFPSVIDPEKVINFEFRPDDILLPTFPKTGSTWLSELVWLLSNSLDFQKALEVNQIDRVFFLESQEGFTRAESQTGPRVIKTHYPLSILFEQESRIKPKIVSITRDLKDTLVSYYYFQDALTFFKSDSSSIDEFIDEFLSDKASFAPLGKYFLHFIEFAKSHPQDCIMLEYEKLHESFESQIDRLCQFLGRPLLSKEEMSKLKCHTSFKEMKKNPASNNNILREIGLLDPNKSEFMRKGKIGDWRNHLSEESSAKVDEYIQKNMPSLLATSAPMMPGLNEIQGFRVRSDVEPEKIINFEFRSDDILIPTYPKTGLTWLSELVWLLSNSLDYKKALEVNLRDRVFCLEGKEGYEPALLQKGPRVIRTHFPPSILFGQESKIKPKIVSITRDLKDTLVSYYYFRDAMVGYHGSSSLEEFIDEVLAGKNLFAPLGKYFQDFTEFTKSHPQDCLMLEYEQLHESFESQVDRLCQFLGRPLLNNAEMSKLKCHTSFEEMKKNPSSNNSILREVGIMDPKKSEFMRKGKVNDWKNHLSEESSAKIDAYIQKNMPSLKAVEIENGNQVSASEPDCQSKPESDVTQPCITTN